MKQIPATKRVLKGQGLVEMAISLVLLLMLISGMVDISIALFQYISMRDAAQEGALYASINPSDEAGAIVRAQSAAADVIGLQNTDIVVTIHGDPCEGLSGGTPNTVTVGVNFTHVLVFPFAGMFGGDMPLYAEVTDTILSPPYSDTCPP